MKNNVLSLINIKFSFAYRFLLILFGLLDLFFFDSAFITFPESRYSERTFILSAASSIAFRSFSY